MKETVMLNILDKLEWLIVRNRTFEAKKVLRIELDNLKGITEQKCKLIKVIKGETGILVVHNNKVYFISDIDNSKY